MTYMEKYQLWLEQVPEASPVHGELLALTGKDKELRERFGEDLTFGTADYGQLWARVTTG